MPPLVLPAAYMSHGRAEPEKYISDLIAFITSPFSESLAVGHPNNVAGKLDDSSIPRCWTDWWGSSWVDEMDLKTTVTAMVRNELSDSDVSRPRAPNAGQINTGSQPFTIAPDQCFGMTPKKQHEVEHMCNLIQSMSLSNSVTHVVDVGAGQGYLTRNLAVPPISLNILALDSNDSQVQGAQRRQNELAKWQAKVFGKKQATRRRAGLPEGEEEAPDLGGIISRDTVFVDGESLPEAIDKWISSSVGETALPIPVIVLGLHACGSLTPAVLRSFVAMCKSETSPRAWRCAGLALVGCCYNRIREIERDFPLSQTVRSHRDLNITSSHLHLAAQVTHNWLSDWPSFELGVRKIVFRATLERLFAKDYGGEMYKSGLQVGRFNDAAYTSWEEYRRRAAGRLGMSDEELKMREEQTEGSEETVRRLQKRLEFLHVLRCMLGPVIESLLLVDRWMMLHEELPSSEVKMVNLFDQSTGSARNVVLVVEVGNK